MILRFGRWKHSGRDFNADRKDALSELTSFVPTKTWFSHLTGFPVIKNFLMTNSVLRMFITQSALVKESLTPHGGHLHAPFLNISYIRIPKSASTSLSSLLLKAIYPELAGKDLSPTQINFLADANIRRNIGNDDNSDIFFTVVRNPFERIVSVYRDFISETARDTIYEDYLFGILQRNISFREFVKRVDGIPDRFKDPHLKPQHYFIDFYKKRNPNVVVLQLEKPDEIKYFLFIYNLEIPHLNASELTYDYREFYDEETLDWVTRVYKQDLKMFGYEQHRRDLQEHIQSRPKK